MSRHCPSAWASAVQTAGYSGWEDRLKGIFASYESPFFLDFLTFFITQELDSTNIGWRPRLRFRCRFNEAYPFDLDLRNQCSQRIAGRITLLGEHLIPSDDPAIQAR